MNDDRARIVEVTSVGDKKRISFSTKFVSNFVCFTHKDADIVAGDMATQVYEEDDDPSGANIGPILVSIVLRGTLYKVTPF